jgi:hypothetical protein
MNDIITFFEIPSGDFLCLMRTTGAYIIGSAAFHGYMMAKNISTVVPSWVPMVMELRVDVSGGVSPLWEVFAAFFGKHGYVMPAEGNGTSTYMTFAKGHKTIKVTMFATIVPANGVAFKHTGPADEPHTAFVVADNQSYGLSQDMQKKE